MMGYVIYGGISLFAGAVGTLFLFFIQRALSVNVFLALFTGWIIVITSLYQLVRQNQDRPTPTYIILLGNIIAGTGLLSIAELPRLQWFIILFTSFIIGWLFWLKRPTALLPHEQKIRRRLLMMVIVSNTTAAAITLFALTIFFPSIPFWLIAPLAGAGFALATFEIWRMYFRFAGWGITVWLATMALVMTELMWVIHLLPFDYGTAGLLVSWQWYVAQLLLRFHLTPQGIVWQKQRWFILGNVIAMLLFLYFFVRWV